MSGNCPCHVPHWRCSGVLEFEEQGHGLAVSVRRVGSENVLQHPAFLFVCTERFKPIQTSLGGSAHSVLCRNQNNQRSGKLLTPEDNSSHSATWLHTFHFCASFVWCSFLIPHEKESACERERSVCSQHRTHTSAPETSESVWACSAHMLSWRAQQLVLQAKHLTSCQLVFYQNMFNFEVSCNLFFLLYANVKNKSCSKELVSGPCRTSHSNTKRVYVIRPRNRPSCPLLPGETAAAVCAAPWDSMAF